MPVGDPTDVGSLANCAVTPGGRMSLPGGVEIHQQQCRSILSQDPFAATALGIIPTPAGSVPGQGVDPSLVLTGVHQTPFKGHTYTFPAGTNSQGPSMDTSETSTYSYDTSSTMETDVTAMEANSVEFTATAGIEFQGFGADASATLSLGSRSTKGHGLTETYSGSSALTTSQSSTTSTNLTDAASPVSVTPFVDQRYSTFMFQAGTNQQFAIPTVSSVSAGAQALKLAVPKSSGTTVTSITVTTPHVAFDAGQQLVFNDGQTLVAAADAAPGDAVISVVKHKLTSSEALNAVITLPGFVTVHGSGFYGPLLVSFCTNFAKVPACTETTSEFAPGVGGDSLYVLAPASTSGSKKSVVARSQSGTTPAAATYTYP